MLTFQLKWQWIRDFVCVRDREGWASDKDLFTFAHAWKSRQFYQLNAGIDSFLMMFYCTKWCSAAFVRYSICLLQVPKRLTTFQDVVNAVRGYKFWWIDNGNGNGNSNGKQKRHHHHHHYLIILTSWRSNEFYALLLAQQLSSDPIGCAIKWNDFLT